MTASISGVLAASSLFYFSYLSAQRDVHNWLSPQVASVQQKDLGRLYSAPLSYWKGLPFSIEEVVEDLRMAGYDQVDFSKVKQKEISVILKAKVKFISLQMKNRKLCSPLSTPKFTRS